MGSGAGAHCPEGRLSRPSWVVTKKLKYGRGPRGFWATMSQSKGGTVGASGSGSEPQPGSRQPSSSTASNANHSGFASLARANADMLQIVPLGTPAWRSFAGFRAAFVPGEVILRSGAARGTPAPALTNTAGKSCYSKRFGF